MGNDSKQGYKTTFYNLDAILSVGYRVNSKNATQFRIWANNILKEYLIKGYAINQNVKVEQFEERCYDLLIRAYIESRYNPNFVVVKEEYEYMLMQTEELKNITMRICTEQIKAYDLLIEATCVLHPSSH